MSELGGMRQIHRWPGHWSRASPQVSDHPQGGAELAWIAQGYPFNRPVLARSNVGVRRAPSWEVDSSTATIEPKHEQFVRVELMADGFHGQQATDFGWFNGLEWMGPLLIPSSMPGDGRKG